MMYDEGGLLGRGSHGPRADGPRADGVLVPVPEDERSLVLAGPSEDRIAAVVEPTPMPASDSVPPTLPG
eukprot:16174024-Heterocapsa_arctica.AAC.1